MYAPNHRSPAEEIARDTAGVSAVTEAPLTDWEFVFEPVGCAFYAHPDPAPGEYRLKTAARHARAAEVSPPHEMTLLKAVAAPIQSTQSITRLERNARRSPSEIQAIRLAAEAQIAADKAKLDRKNRPVLKAVKPIVKVLDVLEGKRQGLPIGRVLLFRG